MPDNLIPWSFLAMMIEENNVDRTKLLSTLEEQAEIREIQAKVIRNVIKQITEKP
jgi:hypothetical protein